MKANSNGKNNEKVELKRELFTGLFLTSMFKMDEENEDIYIYKKHCRTKKVGLEVIQEVEKEEVEEGEENNSTDENLNNINTVEDNLEEKKKSGKTYGDAIKDSIVVQRPKHKNDEELEFVDNDIVKEIQCFSVLMS